jgi:rod shape-determining protein MreD
MRFLRSALALAAVIVLQLLGSRLMPTFPLLFDLPLLVVIQLGLSGNLWAGLLGGLVAGMASDALGGGLFGLHGFCDTLVGYSLAVVASRFMLRQTAAVALGAAVATALKLALLGILGVLLFSPPQAPSPLWALLTVATTTLLSLLVHLASRRLGGDDARPVTRELRLR